MKYILTYLSRSEKTIIEHSIIADDDEQAIELAHADILRQQHDIIIFTPCLCKETANIGATVHNLLPYWTDDICTNRYERRLGENRRLPFNTLREIDGVLNYIDKSGKHVPTRRQGENRRSDD